MSKPQLILISAALGALVCGIILALLMGIRAIGTSMALPGLGVIVAGPLAAAIVGALLGAVIGFVLGLLAGVIIILARR